MYCEETNVKEGVDLLRNHPAMPKDITIDGYVMDIETGDLVKIA